MMAHTLDIVAGPQTRAVRALWVPISPRRRPTARDRDDMARLDPRNVAKERSRSLLRNHHQKLRHHLLIGSIRNFGKSVQAFRHRSECEEPAAAMIVERPLAEEIACQQKLLRRTIPQRKSEIADEPC